MIYEAIPDPVRLDELPPPDWKRLAFWTAVGWLAWLRFGTRSNPPVPYDKFRTGLTFADVREMLKREQDAAYRSGQYMFVSRATVLGRMHQLKREQYARYLAAYAESHDDLDPAELDELVDPQGDDFGPAPPPWELD